MHTKCGVYYTFSGCDHSICASYSTNHARVTSVTLKRWRQSCRSSPGLMLTSNAAAAAWDVGLQGGASKGLLRFYSSFFSAVSIMNWQISVSCYVIVYFGTLFLPGSASYADYSSVLENKERMSSRSMWHLLRKLVFAWNDRLNPWYVYFQSEYCVVFLQTERSLAWTWNFQQHSEFPHTSNYQDSLKWLFTWW